MRYSGLTIFLGVMVGLNGVLHSAYGLAMSAIFLFANLFIEYANRPQRRNNSREY